AVRAALARHPRIGPADGIRIELDDGVITLEGTLRRIAARRIVPRLAAEATGLGIRDRLRLARPETRDDASIAADLERALAADPAFVGHDIGRGTADNGERRIAVSVRDAVVRLEGRAASLLHR